MEKQNELLINEAKSNNLAVKSNKQIDEMEKVLEGVPRWEEARLGYYRSKAKYLYNAGYRKASDVAMEIITEIRSIIRADGAMDFSSAIILAHINNYLIAAAKKYTEEVK